MNHSGSTRKMGLAVLAGGLAFVGGADATELILDGSFENTTSASDTVRVGGRVDPDVGQGWSIFSTYLYSTQYTFPGPPNSGGGFLRPYAPGVFGVSQSSEVVTQLVSLTASTGLTGDEIDAGFGQYTFSAWFSSYLTQGDFSTVTVEFFDDVGSLIAIEPVVLGGQEFVANIPIGSNGRYPDAKQWVLADRIHRRAQCDKSQSFRRLVRFKRLTFAEKSAALVARQAPNIERKLLGYAWAYPFERLRKSEPVKQSSGCLALVGESEYGEEQRDPRDGRNRRVLERRARHRPPHANTKNQNGQTGHGGIKPAGS